MCQINKGGSSQKATPVQAVLHIAFSFDLSVFAWSSVPFRKGVSPWRPHAIQIQVFSLRLRQLPSCTSQPSIIVISAFLSLIPLLSTATWHHIETFASKQPGVCPYDPRLAWMTGSVFFGLIGTGWCTWNCHCRAHFFSAFSTVGIRGNWNCACIKPEHQKVFPLALVMFGDILHAVGTLTCKLETREIGRSMRRYCRGGTTGGVNDTLTHWHTPRTPSLLLNT